MAVAVSSTSSSSLSATTDDQATLSTKKCKAGSVLRWIPTSTDHIISSEKRLLSLVKTPYTQEQVDIGSGPPGSQVRWFRSSSNEPRFINTVTFDNKNENAPTLVMIHGYAASQGFFFRNFDDLAKHFRVIAIDQLGWGGSSRPDFTCKSTEETEAWFVESLEAWRKAKNLTKFTLLGHSFGGYVAGKYALKYPEHVQHLLLVGAAGFSSEADEKNERLLKFRATWQGSVLNHLWESNFTPQKVIRGLGPWGPNLVRRYTGARFGENAIGDRLTEEESKLLTDYLYHTLVAKASGELCLKYIFSIGAFARLPLVQSASEWKVPTTFIYGDDDWMYYEGAQEAQKHMKVPCEIIRVPEGGHFVFMDNASGFHSAVLYACRSFLSSHPENYTLPEDCASYPVRSSLPCLFLGPNLVSWTTKIIVSRLPLKPQDRIQSFATTDSEPRGSLHTEPRKPELKIQNISCSVYEMSTCKPDEKKDSRSPYDEINDEINYIERVDKIRSRRSLNPSPQITPSQSIPIFSVNHGRDSLLP